MKKTLFAFAAVVAALVSCQKEVTPVAINENELEARDSFVASLGDATKTTIDGALQVKWATDDSISVNGVIYEFESYIGSDSTMAEFTKRYKDQPSPKVPFTACFPADCYGSDGQLALPKTIIRKKADDFGMAMLATTTSRTMTFKNICAVLAVTVKSSDIPSVNSIKISSSNRALSGAFSVLDGQTALLTDSTSVSNDVTLVCAEPVATAVEGTEFYIAVPAQTYQNLKIQISGNGNSTTKFMTTKKDVDIAVASNTVYPVAFKAAAVGISNITRLWGSYGIGKEGDFLTKDAERGIAMDNSYIYIPNAGAAKVRAISLADYSVRELSVDGISGGTHVTSGARVMDNGSSTILLVHNMASGNVAQTSKLKVYAYDTPDSTARTVLEYVIPAGVRLGDKMTTIGTWQDGELLFFDYKNSSDRKFYAFKVTDGVVSQTPTVTSLGYVVNGNSIAGVYKYSDAEYAWSGTANYTTVFSVVGGTFTSKYVGDKSKFTLPAHDLNFININGTNYMASLTLRNSFADAALRLTCLAEESLEESLRSANTATDIVLGLGCKSGEQITAKPKDVNGTGGIAVRTIGGKLYIAALASNIGVVLFTVE